MTREWQQRPEGGGRFALWLFSGFALHCGRGIARLVLHPITLYFMLRRGPERRASRAYLTRVLGRRASWWQVARHFHCFAAVTLDRVFLLSRGIEKFDIRSQGLDELHALIDRRGGVLMLGAHLGSFEALRALSLKRPDVHSRVVVDVVQNPSMSTLLNALNPGLAASLINARQDGTAIVLAIKETLDERGIVTMLADRARPGNTMVKCRFLGDEAPFPTAPWLIAATLRVPVALCFGLYRGGNCYDLYFETFAETLSVERRTRAADLAVIVQRYADRLGDYARRAPYNWFNFYDFWNADDAPTDAARAADAASGAERGR